jgi:hypothetical protein
MGQSGVPHKMESCEEDDLNLSKQLDKILVVRQNNSHKTNSNIEGVEENGKSQKFPTLCHKYQ